jgi:hypothetical protein
MSKRDGQVVLLPAQLDRLAKLGGELGHAIGISAHSNTCVIEVNTGSEIILIDPQGDDVQPSEQEKLC